MQTLNITMPPRTNEISTTLDDRELEAFNALCEERGMSADALLRQALRVYQNTLHPLPDFPIGGCMGDD